MHTASAAPRRTVRRAIATRTPRTKCSSRRRSTLCAVRTQLRRAASAKALFYTDGAAAPRLLPPSRHVAARVTKTQRRKHAVLKIEALRCQRRAHEQCCVVVATRRSRLMSQMPTRYAGARTPPAIRHGHVFLRLPGFTRICKMFCRRKVDSEAARQRFVLFARRQRAALPPWYAMPICRRMARMPTRRMPAGHACCRATKRMFCRHAAYASRLRMAFTQFCYTVPAR